MGLESHQEVAPLPLYAVGKFFLNKVWNALLCFIICPLILLLFTFTNRALRKKWETAQETQICVRPGSLSRATIKGELTVKEADRGKL